MTSEQADLMQAAASILEQDPATFSPEERLMAAGLLTQAAQELPQGHPMRGPLAQEAALLVSPTGSAPSPSTTSETG